MAKEDVKNIYLVQHNNLSGSHLSVTFWSEKLQRSILEGSKELFKQGKPIITDDLLNLGNNENQRGKRIYIRAALTKTNASLLKQAMVYKGRPFKFVWNSFGRILVKVSDDDRPKQITSPEQINELINMK